MKQLLLVLSFSFSFLNLSAQKTDPTQAILRAYASGENNVATLNGSDTYDPAKKYIVFKFWNEKDPLTENERTDLDYLKKFLPKKNVELVELKWNNLSELKEAVKKYNLEVSESKDEHFMIKGENFHMNTTSQKAMFVIEDGKPVTMCCGKFCEVNLKQYFKLQTIN
jgi:hypothetical protein